MRPSISTFDGFTSRCSTPAACTLAMPSASDRANQVRSAPLDRPVLLDLVVQGVAGDVAGGDVRDRAPRVGVDDLGDPLAADPAQRGHLAGEPGPGLVVADDVRPQHLERDALAARLARQVHHAHAALAEARQQGVAADRQAGRSLRARLPGRHGHAYERNRRIVESGGSRTCTKGSDDVSRPGASSRTCRPLGRTGCRPAPAGSASSARRRRRRPRRPLRRPT